MEERADELIQVDPFKLYMFLHLFYKKALGDYLAVGGAVQIPSILFNHAIGLGIQPEITFCFRQDPFDGPFIGLSGWLNYIYYTQTSIDKHGTEHDVGKLSEIGVSFAPLFGFYVEGPANGLIIQIMAGPEFNLVPTTQDAVGLWSSIEGTIGYLSVRFGYRW